MADDTFLSVLDAALAAANQILASALVANDQLLIDDVRAATRDFGRFKTQVINGTLREVPGASLDISRALGEWPVPDHLYDAGLVVETYHSDHWFRNSGCSQEHL